MLYPVMKAALFRMPPEKAHDLTVRIASLSPALGTLLGIRHDSRLSLKVGKLEWPFPIGLAAGLDKNAEALAFFENQGFGAVECGTITMRPQTGNDRPRMWRYPDEKSLRNAMGFPNQGLHAIWQRLHAFERKNPLGANIGKNKETGRDESIDELALVMSSLEELVDYFVINVSSPNTPGLRAFQEKTYLTELFKELNQVRGGKDLYLKIAPDLEPEKIRELAETAVESKLTGLIATNTTIMAERGAGGMSGEILRTRANNVRSTILEMKLPIELIGVGGVSDFSDLLSFWSEGGKVMQVYTSYVYQGPELLHKMKHDMEKFLAFIPEKTLQEFMNLPLDEKQKRIRETNQRSS
ncbi:MAG: quinone-dependent dihydroorotate dehydrogenase [Bacteriovoracaceae bacterium]